MEILLGIFGITAIIFVLQLILSIFLNKIPEDKPSSIAKITSPIFILVSLVLILLGIVIPFLAISPFLSVSFVFIGIVLLLFSISYYREKYVIPKYKQSQPSFEEKRERMNNLTIKSSEEFQARHFQ